MNPLTRILLAAILFLITIMGASAQLPPTSNSTADYLIMDQFSRADSTNFGNAATGQAWTEGVTSSGEIVHKTMEGGSTGADWGSNCGNQCDHINASTEYNDSLENVTWYVEDLNISSIAASQQVPFEFVYDAPEGQSICIAYFDVGDFKYRTTAGYTDTGENYAANTNYNLTVEFDGTADNCRYTINGSVLNYATGWVDDWESASRDYTFNIWHGRPLVQYDSLYMWVGGKHNAPQAGASVTLTTTHVAPSNNTHTANLSSDIDISFLLNETNAESNNFDCTLWYNTTATGGTLVNATELTTTTLNATNTFSAASIFDNQTVEYQYLIECSNGTVSATNSSLYNLVVDRTNPIPTLQAAHTLFAADNTTSHNKLLAVEEENISLTYTDTYMNATNLTIYNSTGAKMYSAESTGLTCNECNLTASVNLTTWAVGTYYANWSGADDHTAAEIPDYEYSAAPDTISYVTPTATITITNTRAEGDVPTTDKLTDRYNFSFGSGANASKTTWTFVLTSDRPLYYRGDLYPFPVFVTGSQWVDFDTGFNTTIYEVRQEDAYTFEIEIETEHEGDIMFSSVGGLNLVTHEYEFTVIEALRQDENLTQVDSTYTTINVTWDRFPEATTTEVYLDGVNVANTTDENYTFSSLNIGTSYQAWVFATNGSLTNTSSSSENNITIVTDRTNQVENISTVANTSTSINLTWDLPIDINYTELWRDGTNLVNLTVLSDGVEDFNDTYDDTGGAFGSNAGVKLSSAVGLYIKNVTLWTGGAVDPSRFVILDSTNATLLNVSVTAGFAEPNYTLTAGTTYYLMGDHSVAFNAGRDVNITGGFNWTHFSYIAGCSTICSTDRIFSIESVGYEVRSQNYTDTGLVGGTTYEYTAIAVHDDDSQVYRNTTNSSENVISVTTPTNATINAVIRNEVINEQIVGVNISLNLIGTTNYSYSTTTGAVDLSGIASDNYTVRHGAVAWGLRDQYLEVTNTTNVSLVLYLLNDTFRGPGIVSVVDTSGQLVEGAILKLLRYYPDEGGYNVVEMETTNYAGEAGMDAQIYDAYYKWIVEYNDVTRFISTQPEQLIPTSGTTWTRVFTIEIGNDFYKSYQALTGLGTTLTWNNATETFTYTWNDPSGLVDQGCLYAKYPSGAQWLKTAESCDNGSVGSVLLTVTDSNTTIYEASGYVHTDTNYSNTITDTIRNALARQYDFGMVGTLLGTAVLMGGAVLFSFSAVVVVIWTALITMLFTISPFLHLFPFTFGATIGFITLIIGIALYLMRR